MDKKNLPDPIRYNPARDLAYLAPDIVEQAVRILIKTKWAAAEEFRLHHGVTEEDVQKACVVLERYLTDAVSENSMRSTPLKALQDSGWFELPWKSRSALLMAIGNVVLVDLFRSTRQVFDGEKHPCPIQKGKQDADFLAAYLEAGFIRRKLIRAYSWWLNHRLWERLTRLLLGV